MEGGISNCGFHVTMSWCLSAICMGHVLPKNAFVGIFDGVPGGRRCVCEGLGNCCIVIVVVLAGAVVVEGKVYNHGKIKKE